MTKICLSCFVGFSNCEVSWKHEWSLSFLGSDWFVALENNFVTSCIVSCHVEKIILVCTKTQIRRKTAILSGDDSLMCKWFTVHFFYGFLAHYTVFVACLPGCCKLEKWSREKDRYIQPSIEVTWDSQFSFHFLFFNCYLENRIG